MTKDTWRILAMHRVSGLSWVHLARDEQSSDPKGWTRGEHQNWTRIGSHNSYLQGKYGVEIRVESVNKDNSHSWVRISHGLKIFDTNLNNTSEMQFEDCVKIECKWLCKPIKGQSKTTRTYFCQLIHKDYTYWWENLGWYWTTRTFALRSFSVEETDQSSSSWKSTREDDGAIEFWRIKDYLQDHFVLSPHWSDEKWKSMFGRRRRTQEKISVLYWSSGVILYLRVLKVIQDAIFMILDYMTMSWFGRFLQVHLSRRMCNQSTFHHHFRIDTGRTNFEQETDSILSACGSCG